MQAIHNPVMLGAVALKGGQGADGDAGARHRQKEGKDVEGAIQLGAGVPFALGANVARQRGLQGKEQ